MSKEVLYKGPDISYHQGNVNIKRIRDAGCKRIGIRAGYGKNNVDQKYIVNAQACYNLNVAVLLYWFSYAYTVAMAAAEGVYACVQASKFWIENCTIAFDFEYDSVNYARKNGVALNRETVTDMAIAFLQKVKEAGHIPVIYTNRDYLRNWFDMDRIVKELGTVYVWYARYSNSITEEEQELADVWQYTSKGKLDGVNGNVDMNEFYTDFEQEAVKAEREEKCNINILNFQKAANADGYRDMDGMPLVEDGIDGPKTQHVRRQIAMRAKLVDGKWKVGTAGAVEKWWQGRCNEILGRNNEEDGLFGANTRNETLDLQELLVLKEDGIAGYNSIQAVFYH